MTSRPQVALIADDDEFFRMALGAILTGKLGFAEVVETCSLDEAVETLSVRGDISLALFDLSMPGMEGPANLRAVRDCFAELRVAVVSGSQNRNDVLAALAAGVHGYVPKGLGVSDLARALRQIIDGVIYVPPSIAILPANAVRDPALAGRLAALPVESSCSMLDTLTPRQRSVLALLVRGQSNKAIARDLQLGEGTVTVHMAALCRGLGVKTRTAAAVAGGRLLPPPS